MSLDALKLERKKIDLIDTNLLRLLAKRNQISKKIGLIKIKKQLPLRQPIRWNSLLLDRMKKGHNKGLSLSFTKKLFELVHKESLRTQRSQISFRKKIKGKKIVR